jgi:metallo-beta-lactamase class B
MIRIITTIVISLLFLTKLFGQNADSPLKITQLTGDFYIFTTYNLYKGIRVPANGMYLLTKQGVVLFDSPWDTTQFQPLLDSIQVRHHTDVLMCIATHFHEDRTGGLAYYRQKGIKTYTTKQTDELSKARGMKRAEYLLYKDSVFTVGAYSFKLITRGRGMHPTIW